MMKIETHDYADSPWAKVVLKVSIRCHRMSNVVGRVWQSSTASWLPSGRLMSLGTIGNKHGNCYMSENSLHGPLAGVRVIDFGQYVAGPGAAMMLADQGADVIRVERPEGPSMDSPATAVLNRGKRTVTSILRTRQSVKPHKI